MYFDSREIQDEWLIELQKATGNLNIHSYYKVFNAFKLLEAD